MALVLVMSFAASAEPLVLRPKNLGQRVAFSLLGGAGVGAVFAGIALYTICNSGCSNGYVVGIGGALAWSTGVALGVFGVEKLGPDEVDVLPAIAGTTLGLGFATAVTLLGQNDRDRLVLGIPAMLVLPLAFAAIAMEYARPEVEPGFVPVPGGAMATIGGRF